MNSGGWHCVIFMVLSRTVPYQSVITIFVEKTDILLCGNKLFEIFASGGKKLLLYAELVEYIDSMNHDQEKVMEFQKLLNLELFCFACQ